jgi:hypothetical protein
MLAPSPARAACRTHSSSKQQQQQAPVRAQCAAVAAAAGRAVARRRQSTPVVVAAAAERRSPSAAAAEQQHPQHQLLSMAVAAAPAGAVVALALALAAAGPAEAAATVAAADPAHAASAAHAAAAAASASASPLYALSEGEDFFANVARYGRYFVTVMLGTGYMMAKPVVGLFKKGPVTAVLALGGGAAALYGVKFTLDAMLGLSDAGGLAYDPDAIVSQALMSGRGL